MWVESFWWNYDNQPKYEGNNEQVVFSFNDSRREIWDKALKYYEINKNDFDRVQSLHDFIQWQEQDRTHLREQLEAPVLSETRDELDKQAMINEAKTMLYEKLWINDNLWSNNWWENFWKWLVDTLILDNYDLAIQVWETNWTVIIDWIKQLFSSWENIKKVAEALWESVMWLFSLDWYQTWKSIAELWLIWSWVWAWVYVWKKTVKLWMKQISKLRKSAERLVESSKTKQVIWETVSKVDEIIPKKELDIEALAKKRIDIIEKVEWLEKLWFPESISRDILESWLLNEKFYWWDLLKRFDALQKKWIDYNTMVDDVMKQIPDLTREEALLIFTYTDNTIYRNLNAFMRWDKKVLETMTKENIEVSRRLASKLEKAMEKMPNLEWGKDWFILRWDKWEWWFSKNWKELQVWDEINLDSFTSVSNNRNDILLWKKYWHDILVEIVWKEWKVKDISQLAMFVNFADKLWAVKTEVEWIILPNSIIKFVKKENAVIDAIDNNGKLVPHNIKKIQWEQIK